MMRRVRHVARMGNLKSAYKTVVGKRERKRQLGRSRHWWKLSTEMAQENQTYSIKGEQNYFVLWVN